MEIIRVEFSLPAGHVLDLENSCIKWCTSSGNSEEEEPGDAETYLDGSPYLTIDGWIYIGIGHNEWATIFHYGFDPELELASKSPGARDPENVVYFSGSEIETFNSFNYPEEYPVIAALFGL